MTQPLVSVCVPVLDGGDLVAEAVDSALAQDYPHTEIVVVDDGSSDGTPDLLRRRYGDRIRLLVNPTRSGQSRATNICVAHAQGEFVKFLPHDDPLEPHSGSGPAGALARHPLAGMSFGRPKGLVDHA